MKNIFTFLFVAVTLFSVQLFAQEENGLPNNGLTHKISANEKLLMSNYGLDLFTTNPPVGPIRNIAEFEPSEAAIIAYEGGFGLPYSAIKDLATTGKVIIACQSSSQSTALSLLNSNGVNTANCSFLTTPLDSWWTRDYTGWFIADSSNHIALVDFTYNRPRPNDDAIGALEANLLGVDFYEMDLIHTGGNYMCDGYGKAVSTTLTVAENPTLTQTQIQQRANDYLGINDYMLLPDAQGQYIEHIDCWGKYLAPDKVLVDSVPSTDPRWSNYEAAASFFASTNCAYGYNYKVTRVLIAGSSETSTAEPYSNSFIFNNRVLVPIKGGTSSVHDTLALRAYRKAMPGYIVKGYIAAGGAAWYGTDALHCRAHEIADREMLYIEHYPLYGLINSSTGYDINAKIVSYAGNDISTDYPKVIYKVNQGLWDSISMSYISYLNYTANIPTQNGGDTIFYFIKAKDISGKLAFHALMGEDDPHYFIVDGSVGAPEITASAEMSFFTYPNPSKGDFILFMKSNYSEKASVQIFSITGSLVFNEDFDLESGASMKKINTENLIQGVYFIEVKTDSDILTKQLVIQ